MHAHIVYLCTLASDCSEGLSCLQWQLSSLIRVWQYVEVLELIMLLHFREANVCQGLP